MRHGTICLIALAAMLVGCQTPEEVRRLAAGASDAEVCRVVLTSSGLHNQVAWEEMGRRKLDCSPYAAAAQASQARAAQEAAMGLQLLQMSRPQPTPMPTIPPTVICTSRPVGSTVQTVCQ